MKTLEQAFGERSALVGLVENEARTVLADFCNRQGFLLAGRSKDLSSLREKLETGRYPSLDSVDDTIAYSVVIDTLDQEAVVNEFLDKAFNVKSRKSGNTIRDERTFDFDSTRVYCTLGDNLLTGKGSVVFEVQIRTLLQHAWSKITHPHVYKSRSHDPQAGRLAAELMAQLESADRTFASFNDVSKSVKRVVRKEIAASNELTTMIDQLIDEGAIPSEMRPNNGRRLGENIFNAVRRDRRNDYAAICELIRNFILGLGDKYPRSVSIYQLCVVALHEAKLLENGSRKRPQRYYITDELISIFPSTKDIVSTVSIT